MLLSHQGRSATGVPAFDTVSSCQAQENHKVQQVNQQRPHDYRLQQLRRSYSQQRVTRARLTPNLYDRKLLNFRENVPQVKNVGVEEVERVETVDAFGYQKDGLRDQEYCFEYMPNFFIRERRVVRFIPRRAAAPPAPPTRPLHAVSARTISSRRFLAYSSETLVLSLCESVLSSTTFFTSCRVSREPSLLVF
jgi:hypothetical protein